MPFRVQSITVDKMGIRHSMPCRSLIHLFHKSRFTPGNLFCHRHAGIIGTCHSNTLDHRIHSLLLARFQKYLGSAHRCGVLRSCDLGIRRDRSICQRIKDQEQCHNLRHTRRWLFLIRIFFKENLPAGSFHNNCGLSR